MKQKKDKLYRLLTYGDLTIFVERVRRTKRAIRLGMK
jgi:hypothetical protein